MTKNIIWFSENKATIFISYKAHLYENIDQTFPNKLHRQMD